MKGRTKTDPPATILTPTEHSEPARDASRLTFRAKLRPVQVREMGDAGLLEEQAVEELGADWYWFTAEMSSMALDSYFTHMSDSTLRNFAREAAGGVALLDSHNGWEKLGVGYSAGGRYEEEDAHGRAVGVFYIVPGINFGGRHSFASTDDYIRAIGNGAVRDVSVGLYGGRWICDLCHQPYFGRDTACNHIAGWEYEIERDGKMTRELCTVLIDDAHLSEVSLVYDGATPGAMIIKAEQEAEAGRLSPAMARQIEQAYRIKLPAARPVNVETAMRDAPRNSHTTSTANTNVVQTVSGPQPAGVRAMPEEIDEIEQVIESNHDLDTGAAGGPNGGDQAAVADMRAELEAVRRALTGAGVADGVRLHESVRQLGEQLVAAREEVARLQPLADQGRAYREDLINQAVVEGVRSLGEAFPEETYRAMLAGAPLEHIRQVRDTFAAQAAERFPGGRQTRDVNENGDERHRPAVPAAAYGVK